MGERTRLALLATAAWVGSRMGLETEAAIVDHGLQEASASVAERAKAQAERLGVAAHVLRVHVDPAAGGGLEKAAREARHSALDALLEDRGGLALLMAHTLDDQAEQVLMGLARGAGPRALAGIPRSRGALLRPFLGSGRDETTALRRADTEEICRLHDLEWWEDPMNADESMLRARVRHRALPLLREVLGRADRREPRPYRGPGATGCGPPRCRGVGSPGCPGPGRGRAARGAGPAAAGRARADRCPRAPAYPDPPGRLPSVAPDRQTGRGRPSGAKSLLRRQVLMIDALVVSWHGQASVPVPGRIEVARRDGLLVWRRIDLVTSRRTHPTTFPGGDPRAPDAPPPRCRTGPAGRTADPREGRPSSDAGSPLTTRTSPRSWWASSKAR